MALTLSRTQGELDGLGVGDGGRNMSGKITVDDAEAVATDDVGGIWPWEVAGLLD